MPALSWILLFALVFPIAWTWAPYCPQLVVKTSILHFRARAGRVTAFGIKLNGTRSGMPDGVRLRVTLPPGTTYKAAAQRHVQRRIKRGGSLEQPGVNLYFLDVFPRTTPETKVMIIVSVDECPPDALSFGLATYVGNGSCYTTYRPKTLAVAKWGRKSCTKLVLSHRITHKSFVNP